MSRKNQVDLVRRHVYMDDEQWEKLKFYFEGNIGISAAIRTILKSYLAKLDAKANANAKPIGVIYETTSPSPAQQLPAADFDELITDIQPNS